MTSTEKIRRCISKIPDGEVFDYTWLENDESSSATVSKTLSRLSKSGEIVRLSKGKYYKPAQTRFGSVRPAENQIIKSLAFKGGRPIGYLTGTAIYNSMGLTTQVTNVLEIVRNGRLPEKEIHGYKIKFINRSIKFKAKEIPLLQFLDALRDIRSIPDSSVPALIPVFGDKIAAFTDDELSSLTRLGKEYNPATRALLGALLEHIHPSRTVDALKKSLSPFSTYKLNIPVLVLPNKASWNIV